MNISTRSRLAFGVAVASCLAVPALADEALARKSGCLACHGIDRKSLGPSFKQVADKHRGQPDTVQQLATRIRSGGSGLWGPVPMPAQPQLKDADVDTLAQWINNLP